MVEPVTIITLSVGLVSGLAMITERLIRVRGVYLKNRMIKLRLLRDLENDGVGKFYRELILRYPD